MLTTSLAIVRTLTGPGRKSPSASVGLGGPGPARLPTVTKRQSVNRKHAETAAPRQCGYCTLECTKRAAAELIE